MKKLFTLLLFSIQFQLQAQTDTSFWFAAPEVSANTLLDRPIKLQLATYGQPAIITVNQPAGNMPPQVFNLPANSFQSLDLTPWIDSIECKPANTILNFGLHISATNNISAYYEVNPNFDNPELYVLKGKNALGTSFYIPSQHMLDNSTSYFPTPYNSFNIIASENNTSVTITPSNNIVGHPANIPFTIILNKGQTYAAIASSVAAAMHLDGSYVTSTKPVAITVSDDLLYGVFFGGCADLAGDQIIPISQIGSEYIAVRGGLNSPYDQLFITASQNATDINKDGVYLTTINAGQTYQTSLANDNTYITTSNPAYLYQLSGLGCEVGAAILPQINCTGSSEIQFQRTTSDNLFITLLVKSSGINNFLVNGVSGIIPGASFITVPGTSSQWYTSKILLPLASYPVNSIINISNTSSLFHLGVLQGDNTGGTSFGYFSNFNVFEAIGSHDTICFSDTLHLHSNSVPSATYSWTGPAGFSSTSQNPSLPNFQSINEGNYILQITIPGCSTSIDTINVTHSIATITATASPQSVCPGSSTTLSGGGGITYTWSGSVSDGVAFTPSSSATYTVTGTNSAGCSNTATVSITLLTQPSVTANAFPSSLCLGKSTVLTGSGAASYTWTGGVSNATSFTPTSSATYTVTGIDANGCTATSTISITVNPLPSINATATPPAVCKDVPTVLNGNGGVSYTWSGGIINGVSFVPISTSTYTVTGTDANGCSNTSSITITLLPPLNVNINQPYSSLCLGDSMLLQANGGSIYSWSPSTGLSATNTSSVYAQPSSNQTYTVIASDANGCTGSSTTSINIISSIEISATKDADIECNKHTVQLTATGAQQYTWTPTTFLTNPSAATTNATVNQTTTFYVTGSVGSCVDIDSVTVYVYNNDESSIFIPNAFSPNEDYINDCLQVKSAANFKSYYFTIYNRWGEKVFESLKTSDCWDGKFKGQASEQGTYFYFLKAETSCGKIFKKGDITLLR